MEKMIVLGRDVVCFVVLTKQHAIFFEHTHLVYVFGNVKGVKYGYEFFLLPQRCSLGNI